MGDVVVALLESLLLPPGLVGAALLIWCVLVFVRRGPIGERALTLAVFCLYYAASTWPLANLAVASLETRVVRVAAVTHSQGAEAIVVLAGNASRASAFGPAELNRASWRRLWRGVEIYYELDGRVPIIFSGGGRTGDTSASAGELAGAAASLWGIDSDLFWIESISTNTYESAVEIKKLMDDRFPGRARHRIRLVTSAWHMPRSAGVFKKAGVDVVPEPCDYRMGERRDLELPQLLPNYGALSTFSVAFREWMAIGFYRVRGRL